MPRLLRTGRTSTIVLATVSFAACVPALPTFRPAFHGTEPPTESTSLELDAGPRCDPEAPAPVSDARAEDVAALLALVRLATDDFEAFSARVDEPFLSRIERAATLHAADAPSPGELASGGGRTEALAETLRATPAGCDARYLADEGRLDFPPPFVETPEANAREIEDVRRQMQEARELTLYCGGCPEYVVLLGVAGDGATVVRGFAPLR